MFTSLFFARNEQVLDSWIILRSQKRRFPRLFFPRNLKISSRSRSSELVSIHQTQQSRSMSSTPVAITCCYICKKSNSKSLRRWESKTGCSTCRNYFTSTFDSAYKAMNRTKIDNIEQDISDEHGIVMSILWNSINSRLDCLSGLNCQDFSKLCIHKAYPKSKCKKCKFRKMFFTMYKERQRSVCIYKWWNGGMGDFVENTSFLAGNGFKIILKCSYKGFLRRPTSKHALAR